MTADEKLLYDNDWIVECESPFEIRHKDGGSFASGLAAEIVRDSYKEEQQQAEPKFTLFYYRKSAYGYEKHSENSMDKLLEWLSEFENKSYISPISIIKE